MDTIVMITVDRYPLSDGSEVHNVSVGGVILHAVTASDAMVLADKLRDAITAHTVDSPIVAYT